MTRGGIWFKVPFAYVAQFPSEKEKEVPFEGG
jgi:hypothetical protein